MAISPMYRTTVLGYAPVMDEVVVALQTAGVLEVEARDYESEVIEPVTVHSDDARLRRIDEQIADATFARDFLGRFHTTDHAFATFVTEKIHLPADEYLGLEFDAHAERIYRECVTISDFIASHEREIDRLTKLVSELKPWQDFHFQISQWKGTDTTVVFTGTVPASEGPAIRARLRETIVNVTVEELGPVDDRQAWVVIAHVSCADAVRAELALTEFREVGFPDLEDYPAEEIEDAVERIAKLRVEIETSQTTARELAAEHYRTLVALVLALESDRDALTVRTDFSRTQRTFVVTGWVPQADRADLETALAPLSEVLDVSFDEPADDEEPPVQLTNPRFLRPFEILTDLYGRPTYRDADPTAVLAPFFLLFFAICIGDFGYGLMLMVGAWLIKTKVDVAPGVKKFMDLLILGGAASMVVGVLLGGYLAIPIDKLPPLLQSLQVLDPIAEIQTFLIVALILGVIQVCFGILLATYHAFRRGDAASAIFDHLSVLVLFVAIAATVLTGDSVWLVAGLVYTMLAQGRAITSALGDKGSPLWDRAMGWLWLGSAVWFVLSFAVGGMNYALTAFLGLSIFGPIVSKTVRRSVLGMLGGAYSVYGMTGYAGDILSYLRLTALGLSSSLVGWVFNILATLVWSASAGLWGGTPGQIAGAVAIAIGATLVFAVGHVFNVVINLLGAFVHPARLQFVEFFSKFYEAGGRPYRPFAFRSENLVLGASGAEREGGSS